MDSYRGSYYDPISLHKYLYAGNDPVNRWDPSGKSFVSVLITALKVGAILWASAVLVSFVNGVAWQLISDVRQMTSWRVPYGSHTEDHPLKSEFFTQFEKAAIDHFPSTWTIFMGWPNDWTTALTLGLIGDGCVAWQEWMTYWIAGKVNKNPIWNQHIQFEPVYFHEKIPFTNRETYFTHQLLRVRFTGLPGKSNFLLDPWRNPFDPIWDEDRYSSYFGVTIREGGYGPT